MNKVLSTATAGFIIAALSFVAWPVGVDAATKAKVSAKTVQNQKKQKSYIAKKRSQTRKKPTVASYFQYLSEGKRPADETVERPLQPLVRYKFKDGQDNPGKDRQDTITPVKITKKEWLAGAPPGPMYVMANWWCSAAADYLYYAPNSETRKKLGIFAGDCTNPDAPIVGSFYPQRLAEFNPAVTVKFILESVDPFDKVIATVTTEQDTACDVDYYRSLGHRDVYAVQFTCDEGLFIGAAKDDFQFTAYVFPPNWPEAANIEAVLKKQTSDADDDGLTLRVERQIGTNPNDKDTDNDSLKDGDEYYAYQTIPTAKDTDGDGVSDKQEVQQQRNPLGPGQATSEQLARWARMEFQSQPEIKNVQLAISTTKAAVTISWQTDELSNGKVNYGETTAYGKLVTDFSFAKTHSVFLGVDPDKTYHYVISACSTGPNPRCIDGPDRTFSTL